MSNFDLIYLLTAAAISIFYGIFGEKIFLREKQYKELARCKKIRKFIIHFSGSAIGFLVLYYLIQKAIFCISAKQYQYSVNIADVLLLIIALEGIMGHFPDVSYKIKEGAENLLGKVIKP
jgi:hypothetical protein